MTSSWQRSILAAASHVIYPDLISVRMKHVPRLYCFSDVFMLIIIIIWTNFETLKKYRVQSCVFKYFLCCTVAFILISERVIHHHIQNIDTLQYSCSLNRVLGIHFTRPVEIINESE